MEGTWVLFNTSTTPTPYISIYTPSFFICSYFSYLLFSLSRSFFSFFFYFLLLFSRHRLTRNAIILPVCVQFWNSFFCWILLLPVLLFSFSSYFHHFFIIFLWNFSPFHYHLHTSSTLLFSPLNQTFRSTWVPSLYLHHTLTVSVRIATYQQESILTVLVSRNCSFEKKKTS